MSGDPRRVLEARLRAAVLRMERADLTSFDPLHRSLTRSATTPSGWRASCVWIPAKSS